MKKKLFFMGLTILLSTICLGQSIQVSSKSSTSYITENEVPERTNRLDPNLRNSFLPSQTDCKKNSSQTPVKRWGGFVPDNKVESVPGLKLKEQTRKITENSEMVTITLIVNNEYATESGYQMLLDADHDTYWDIIIPFMGFLTEEDDVDGSIYNRFEYKIPHNADGLLNTTNILTYGDRQSVDIPEGLYDYCIVNPTIGEGIWLANGDYGTKDDYYFEGGYEYIFELIFEGWYDMVLHTPVTDGGVKRIVSPVSSMDLSASESVEVVIANDGLKDLSGFKVGYQINEDNPVIETFTGTIKSGETANYVFNAKANLSEDKLFAIRVFTEIDYDVLPDNNGLTGYCKKLEKITLPFFEDFSSIEDFYGHWAVIDNNQDNTTWRYEDGYGVEPQPGFARYLYNEENDADDYLITAPIDMKEGIHHLAFWYNGTGTSVESLRVLYGTSSNPEEMNQLTDLSSITNSQWKIKVTNFMIEEAGTYYFALHAYSKADQHMLDIDNISIGEGKYEGTPDIGVDNVLLPVSGCKLSEEAEIQATISNYGTNDIEEFTATYVINNGTPITETFNQLVEIDQTIVIKFQTKADFSKLDRYEVVVYAKCEGQTEISNDTARSECRKIETVVLPVHYDFRNEEEISYWHPYFPNNWIWLEDGGYQAEKENSPLISGCITLPANIYNCSFVFSAGIDLSMFVLPDNFYVMYGKTDTDISTWKIMKEYEGVCTNLEFYTDEIILEIEEEGEYSFAFVSTELNLFVLQSVSINPLAENDICINRFYSTLPRMIPAYQIDETEVIFEADVRNLGKNSAEEVKLHVSMNGELIATSESVRLPFNKVDTLTASAILKDIKRKNTYVFTGEVVMKNEDEFPANNIKEISVVASDSIFAWDKTTDFFDGVSGFSGAVSFGTLFNLNKPDELTSITLGLGKVEKDMEFGLAVYKITELAVEEPLISKRFNRGLGGKMETFSFPLTKMDEGLYYFEVQQLSTERMRVSYDMNPEGFFISNEDNVLYGVTNYGYLCIRPNFGKNPFVGIDNVSGADETINLHYNSSSALIYIEALETFLNRVTIYDLMGNRIYASPEDLNTKEYIVDAKGVLKGVYIAVIETDECRENIKFIINAN